MTRWLALALVLALVPWSPGARADSHGDYPNEAAATVQRLVDEAEEASWPPGLPTRENASEFLGQARAAAEEGRLLMAIESAITFRIYQATEHLVDEVGPMSTSHGREHLANVTHNFFQAAQASVPLHRATINRVNETALSVRGAETALLGAYMVAHGEYLLQFLPQVTALDAFQNNTVDQASVFQRMALTLGVMARMQMGADLVVASTKIHGPLLDPGVMTERLNNIATRKLSASPNSKLVEQLPRGNSEADGPLLRAGLLLLAAEQFRAQEFRLQFAEAAGRIQVEQAVLAAMEGDQADLGPWTRLGSSLSLAAWERLEMRLNPDANVPAAPLQEKLRDRAFARVVLVAEKQLYPAEEHPEEAPLPWITVPLAGLIAAALVARRR